MKIIDSAFLQTPFEPVKHPLLTKLGNKLCSTNLSYLSSIFNDDYTLFIYKDRVRANDASIKSNAILLKGISTAQYTNNDLYIVSKVDIFHADDNVNWSLKSDDDTLFDIDLELKQLTLKKLNTYYHSAILYYLEGAIHVPFSKVYFTSNSGEDYEILDPEFSTISKGKIGSSFFVN